MTIPGLAWPIAVGGGLMLETLLCLLTRVRVGPGPSEGAPRDRERDLEFVPGEGVSRNEPEGKEDGGWLFGFGLLVVAAAVAASEEG